MSEVRPVTQVVKQIIKNYLEDNTRYIEIYKGEIKDNLIILLSSISHDKINEFKKRTYKSLLKTRNSINNNFSCIKMIENKFNVYHGLVNQIAELTFFLKKPENIITV